MALDTDNTPQDLVLEAQQQWETARYVPQSWIANMPENRSHAYHPVLRRKYSKHTDSEHLLFDEFYDMFFEVPRHAIPTESRFHIDQTPP